MGIIGRFKETQSVEMIPVVLHLNARLQPIHRGELFEDMLEEVFLAEVLCRCLQARFPVVILN